MTTPPTFFILVRRTGLVKVHQLKLTDISKEDKAKLFKVHKLPFIL